MHHGKCAYCESNITSITYGCIEHFRPKSTFPELCFDWDNLFLACDICNNATNKGAKFPLPAQGGPYINPASFFDFVYDPTTNLASVVPKQGNTRAELTKDDFGLNRSNLRKRRSSTVRMCALIAIGASKGDTEALIIMHTAVQSGSEYAAFARALAKRLQLKLSY